MRTEEESRERVTMHNKEPKTLDKYQVEKGTHRHKSPGTESKKTGQIPRSVRCACVHSVCVRRVCAQCVCAQRACGTCRAGRAELLGSGEAGEARWALRPKEQRPPRPVLSPRKCNEQTHGAYLLIKRRVLRPQERSSGESSEHSQCRREPWPTGSHDRGRLTAGCAAKCSQMSRWKQHVTAASVRVGITFKDWCLDS